MLSDNIKAARIASDFSKADMARKLEIPYTTYNSYERNEAAPNYKILKKIAEILDVTIDQLLDTKPAHATTLEGDKRMTEITRNAIPVEYVTAKNKVDILEAMETLNLAGQEEAVNHVKKMASVEKYQKKSFVDIWIKDKD